MKKGNDAANEITSETGNVVDVEKCDLASLSSVRECARRLLGKEKKIDLLVNNGGVMCCPSWKTEDRFDMQFGTNHLGHFLLTQMLLPLLEESVGAGFHPRYN